MTEPCPDCGRPLGKDPRRQCAAQILGARAIDHDDCTDVTIARLRAQLAETQAELSRLKEANADVAANMREEQAAASEFMRSNDDLLAQVAELRAKLEAALYDAGRMHYLGNLVRSRTQAEQDELTALMRKHPPRDQPKAADSRRSHGGDKENTDPSPTERHSGKLGTGPGHPSGSAEPEATVVTREQRLEALEADREQRGGKPRNDPEAAREAALHSHRLSHPEATVVTEPHSTNITPQCEHRDEGDDGIWIEASRCTASATHISCGPFRGAPTCGKHKCRCAKPYTLLSEPAPVEAQDPMTRAVTFGELVEVLREVRTGFSGPVGGFASELAKHLEALAVIKGGSRG